MGQEETLVSPLASHVYSCLEPTIAYFFRMVRSYKRITDRAAWSKEDMSLALEDIRQKRLSFRQASAKYNIPRATLYKRIRLNKNYVVNLGRFKPTFTEKEESDLKDHLRYEYDGIQKSCV